MSPGLSCSCVESWGRRVGAESWSLQRLTKRSGSRPPTATHLGDTGPDWALLGGGCNPCSFAVPRTLDLCPRGSQAEAMGRATTGNAAAGPLLAALALGTVWPAVTTLPRGEWLISQPGQVTDLALHAPGSSLGHSGLLLFLPTALCGPSPQQPHRALDCKLVLCVCPITETGQQVLGTCQRWGLSSLLCTHGSGGEGRSCPR